MKMDEFREATGGGVCLLYEISRILMKVEGI